VILLNQDSKRTASVHRSHFLTSFAKATESRKYAQGFRILPAKPLGALLPVTLHSLRSFMAPGAGFEPATNRLTGDCSTAELSRNVSFDELSTSVTF
jgi:hypothetical protein